MSIIDRANQDPHFIFLIDGIGASITALALLLILPHLPEVFTMPVNILYFLGTIALLFAAYSLGNYFAKLSKVKLLISIIAFANLAYCLFSVFIMLQLGDRLSSMDVVYFVGEVMIISALAIFELKVAKDIQVQPT